MITFQMSTHYLPKISLRLEALYERTHDAITESSPSLHHFALIHLLEMMKLVEKPELKSRFLKEFIRLEHVFNKPKLEVENSCLLELQNHIQLLSHQTKRTGETLFQEPLLQSIRLLQHAQHETELDSPPLVFWLQSSTQERQKQLSTWLQDIHPLYETVKLYLSILRNSAKFQTIQIQRGFYQQYLSDKRMCSLILLRINKNLNLYPKIQIGHHGINIRFCDALTMREQHATDAQCELAVSQLW